jgi:hypothetical protein
VNTDHDNDGWFESIRTTRNVFIDRMGLLLGTKADVRIEPDDYNDTYGTTATGALRRSINDYEVVNVTVPTGCLLPSKHLAQEWYSARNWALMPSYGSGKLNALKDFVFQLNPEKRINELSTLTMLPFMNSTDFGSLSWEKSDLYVNVVDTYYKQDTPNAPAVQDCKIVAMTSENQDNPNSTDVETHNTASFWRNFVNSVCSENFDMVLIKIHGLATTKMVLTSVQNIECVRNESYTDAYHHSSNAYSCVEALDRYLENRTRNHRLAFSEITKQKS